MRKVVILVRIEVGNLGPIRKAVVELRPLTLFVGPNSTGKSWLAYTIGAIASRDAWSRHVDDYIDGRTRLANTLIDRAVRDLSARGNAAVAVDELAESLGVSYFQSLADTVKLWLPGFLGLAQDGLPRLELTIDVRADIQTILQGMRGIGFEARVSVSPESGEALLQITKEPGNSELYLYTESKQDVLRQLPQRALRRAAAEAVFQLLHRALNVDTFIFPTERTAYVQFPLTDTQPAMRDEDVQVRLGTGENLPRPVSMFLRWMREAYRGESDPRNTDTARGDYLDLAKKVEVLIGGKVRLRTSQDGVQQLRFAFAEGVDLAVGSASSMVKELAPLSMYLERLALPGQLVVFDEPEMNLHPSAQAAMVEILSLMASAQLRVIATTHSPYIVDHLLNLIRGRESSKAPEVASRLFLADPRAFIEKENVAAYFFADGTAKSILDGEGMIDWRTFSDVSDRIAQIYYDL